MKASSMDTIIHLVRMALHLNDSYSMPSNIDWDDVTLTATKLGLGALVSDGLHILYDSGVDLFIRSGTSISKQEKIRLINQLVLIEQSFEKQERTILELATFFEKKNIKMMVIKGYGLSFMYPTPSHRPSGDIDIYLFGRGAEGDALLAKELGLNVKQNEEKHSVFKYKGITVENHATFMNLHEFPSTLAVEQFLMNQVVEAPEQMVAGKTIYFPTQMMNAVYLPCHIAGHFVFGGLSFKHIIDWAAFLSQSGRLIDWKTIFDLSYDVGFSRFLNALNGCMVDHFGIPIDVFPEWEREHNLEKRLWEGIIVCVETGIKGNKFHRARSFISSKWKYDIVFKESFYKTFLKRSWASFRGKYLPNSTSVWGS